MKKKNSKRTFFNDFDDFDDFDEYEDSEIDNNADSEEKLESHVSSKDFSDVSYDDFNKAIDIDEDEDDYEDIDDEDEEYDDDKKRNVHISRKHSVKNGGDDLINSQLLVILNNFWLIFRVIGVILAIILLIYFLIAGRIQDIFTFLLLLAGSFGFGFGFMFLVNKLMES